MRLDTAFLLPEPHACCHMRAQKISTGKSVVRFVHYNFDFALAAFLSDDLCFQLTHHRVLLIKCRLAFARFHEITVLGNWQRALIPIPPKSERKRRANGQPNSKQVGNYSVAPFNQTIDHYKDPNHPQPETREMVPI